MKHFFFILLIFTFEKICFCCSQSSFPTKWSAWSSPSCLRGANIWQVVNDANEYGTSLGNGKVGPPFSQNIFDQLKRLGANAVNISHPGLYTQNAPYQLDKKVQENLDSLLAKIQQAQLLAIISFRTGPGRTEKAFAPPPSPVSANQIWKSKRAQDAWVKMWQTTALRYAHHPAVIGYHLMVEPNPNSTVVNEWDPASFEKKYGGTLYDWYALAKRLIASIRSVDLETPILVSALNWGDVNWLTRMPTFSDTKTAYVIHQYEPFLYTHQTQSQKYFYPGYYDGTWDGIPEKIDKNFLAKLLQPARDFQTKFNVPIAVLEYGLKHRAPDSGVFLGDELEQFENLGASHTIWLWESDYSGVDWDDFNIRAATDPKFLEALKSNWSKNKINTGFATKASTRRDR